jgi:hypothetical protein
VIRVEQRQMAIFDEHGDNVQRGDCLTACVASVLELPIDEVPVFVESDSWWNDYLEFFRERGFLIEGAFMRVDETDPLKLCGWPSERYWIATVKSPRGKTRCSVCKGEKATSRQWDGELGDYVEFDEPQPCGHCEATGLVASLHAVVMYGRDLVWDPHPQRDMGHLGFVSGNQFGVADPSLLVPRETAAFSDIRSGS